MNYCGKCNRHVDRPCMSDECPQAILLGLEQKVIQDNVKLSNSADIIQLAPHTRLTPEQAIALAVNYEWTTVVCMGYTVNSPNKLVMLSSAIDNKDALWLNRQFEDWICNRDNKL